MAKKSAKQLPSWEIVEIRNKGRYLGTVEAATADQAIKVAIREYSIIDPERQRRLSATRIES